MLIAQLTDIHLGFEPDDPNELNRRRLDRAVAAVMAHKPDLVLATGDLTENGDPPSYARLREAFAAIPCPVLATVGNHDLRDNFLAAFPETPVNEGFVQYVVEDWPLRLVVLDTLEEGRHGGAFCEARAAWLEARLAEAPDRPTLVVLHHPPIETGIDWMTIAPGEPWAERLAAVVSRHRHVVAVVCGHIHRQISCQWAGTTLIVCPSTAPQVTLDLRPMDPDRPDGRPLIVAEPPAYALHLWTGERLVSHLGRAEDDEVLARYEPKFQGFIRHLFDERGA
ncbi:MAG TPA: phosphodiesterase [Caulobacteraceae bacterium]|nr:phosphodiesterase [Caulobacteraceae bacterium]